MTELTIPNERIERAILLIRGHKVMLADDLARLYEVPTKALNQAVRRNIQRFPDDFMFQLTWEEAKLLRSQFVTLDEAESSPSGSSRGKHTKYRPYAFTEHGVVMLSSVLNSERAIHVSIAVVRTFVKLRQLLASNAELARRLTELERKYDEQFQVVFEAIRKLMIPPETKRRRIGFNAGDNTGSEKK